MTATEGHQPRLPIQLSVEDAEPLYRQVEQQLRDLVLSGRLPPGFQLPSVRGLARELSCSVITTRRAYEELTREGLIRTRQGMGAVVANVDAGDRRKHRHDAVYTAVREAVETGRHMGCSRSELEEIFRSVIDEALTRESG